MDSYFQFLETTYCKIIDACAQDQSLNILKTLDNKNFYLSRIHQLFSEIYSMERQNQIKALLQQNTKLKGLQPQKYEFKPRQKNYDYKKQPEAILIRQNQRLSKQLAQLREDQLQQFKQLSEVNAQRLRQKDQQLQKIAQKLQLIEQQNSRLVQKYNTNCALSQKLNDQKKTQKQRSQIYQQRNKQLICNVSMLEQKNQKLCYENKIIKQTNTIYENKVKQLCDSEKNSRQKLKQYEKQLHRIGNTLSNNGQITVALCDDKQQFIGPILSALQQKQNEKLVILQKNERLNQRLQSIQTEYTEYKIFCETQLLQYKQKNRRDILNYEQKIGQLNERLLKVQKQQRNNSEYSKSQNEGKQRKILEMEQQIKIKNKRMQFLQKTNKQLIGQYDDIVENNKKQINMIENDKIKIEGKLRQAKKLQKQLMKQIKIQNTQQQSLQEHYRTKITQQQQLIQKLQSQIASIMTKNYNRNQHTIKQQHNTNKLIQQQYQLKIDKVKSQYRNLQLQHKQLRQQLKYQQRISQGKSKQIVNIQNQIISMIAEQKQYKQKQERNRNRMEQLEKMLNDERKKNSRIQDNYRKQISQIYENNQKNIQEITKQYQKHYAGLLTQYKSTQNNNMPAQNSIKIVRQLEYNLNQCKIQTQQLNHKIQSKNKQIQTLSQSVRYNQKQIMQLQAQIIEMQNNQQNLQNGKISVIQYYEDKLKKYRNHFREFKYQFCQQVLSVMKSLKQQLKNINNCVYMYMGLSQSNNTINNTTNNTINTTTNNTINNRELILNISQQITNKLINYNQRSVSKYTLQIKQLRQNIIPNLKQQKIDQQSLNKNKLRQKSLQTMAIIAEKQYQINNLKQEKTSLQKRYNVMENQYQKLHNQYNRAQQQSRYYKDVMKKMQQKVDQIEKQKQCYRRQLQISDKTNEEFKTQIMNMQCKHQNQLNKCRQKYAQQNQRMFNRYEKQFGKMIRINQKTKQYMVQRILPTKQENKVQKLKRQILQQKMKLESMQRPSNYK